MARSCGGRGVSERGAGAVCSPAGARLGAALDGAGARAAFDAGFGATSRTGGAVTGVSRRSALASERLIGRPGLRSSTGSWRLIGTGGGGGATRATTPRRSAAGGGATCVTGAAPVNAERCGATRATCSTCAVRIAVDGTATSERFTGSARANAAGRTAVTPFGARMLT